MTFELGQVLGQVQGQVQGQVLGLHILHTLVTAAEQGRGAEQQTDQR